jgi:crotonobetainyl-CoA:carnitine CoA-transferase CaiB-like acyl-CoA transferase
MMATATRAPSEALSHLRVLDLGIITAGAATSQIMGDLGADVIKIEAPSRPDPFRRWTQVASPASGQTDLNASPPFQTVNRNKRGMALDLKHPDGRRVFLELFVKSDIVVENFRCGVLDRLSVGFADLKRVKPDIILASLTSQGGAGPEAGYSSYGSTLDALGGLMSLNGYGPETPRWSGTNVNYPDQVVSLIAPGVILAAVRHRDQTGEPVHVDLSQREVVTFLLGEYVVDAAAAPRRGPQGNRNADFAPQGVYACAGKEQWIALSIGDDAQWVRLCDIVARDPAISAECFATAQDRHANADAIDALLGDALREWDRDRLAARLVEAGIPASPVFASPEVLKDPQLAALGFFQSVENMSFAGWRQRGFNARLSKTPATIHSPAPRLGEKSREILTDILGYSDEKIEELLKSGAVFADRDRILKASRTCR